MRYPTLIYGDEIPSEIRARFSSETLQFADAPLNLAQAAQQCELAILNGTHATTSAVLLAGKPVLQIPISGEQYLTAQRTSALGCGPSVPCTDGQAIIGGLKWVVESREARLAARRFAARYDGFDPDSQVQQIASRIEQLVVTSPTMG
jgi:UDP:flavonoid glycosyltransferase YjiC (YdhE family)